MTSEKNKPKPGSTSKARRSSGRYARNPQRSQDPLPRIYRFISEFSAREEELKGRIETLESAISSIQLTLDLWIPKSSTAPPGSVRADRRFPVDMDSRQSK